MEKHQQRIADLLDKYVSKSISEEEFKALFSYIEDPAYREEVLNYLKGADKIQLPDAEAHHIDWDLMYQQVIHTPAEKMGGRSFLSPFFRSYLAIAAVSVLTFLGITFFFIRHQEHPVAQEMAAVVFKDLRPGTDKAFLKLDDGTEIVLDNEHEGTLAYQGATAVQTANGRVIYQSTGKASSTEVLYNSIHTPRGGQYRLILPDKSEIWLNAESSIRFPTLFTGKEREVEVTGEVYFEVASDKSKPFKVRTGNALIEVLGTHFNVMSYTNEANHTVTLVEGSVKISNGGAAQVLTPGQQAVFQPNSSHITLRTVDVDQAVDWKNGLFIFEDASVPEVMRRIERWYDVDVVYNQQNIPKDKFTGVIRRNTNVSKLLGLLQQAGGVSFEIRDKMIEVKTNK